MSCCRPPSPRGAAHARSRRQLRACPLLLGLLLASAGCRQQDQHDYITQVLGRGDLSDLVSATGQVSARNKVNVGSQVSGRVARVLADYNSEVARDQLLAELDTRLFRAQLASEQANAAVAQADLDKARVTLADGERTLARQRGLLAERMVAQADLDQAELQRDAARAALCGAQARLEQARAMRDQAATNLSFASIRSPIDGVVIDRQVELGQTVAAQMQVTTLFVIAESMGQVRVLADVDESDVGKVVRGMPVTFAVDAYPGERFAGEIHDVRQVPSTAATTTSTVVTYAADILADNARGQLRHGMTAHVDIVVGARRGVLKIPNRALRFAPTAANAGRGNKAGDQGGRAERSPEADKGGDPRGAAVGLGRAGRAFQLVAGRAEPAALRLGLSDGMASEVLDGLGEGAVIITGEHLANKRRRGWL